MALLRGLVALLLAWLAMAPSEAVADPSVPLTVYTYDSHASSALGNYATTERGPPPAYDLHAIHTAVDRWSRGASARSDEPTPRAATAYDAPADLVQSAQATGANAAPPQVPDGESCAVSVGQVAANSGVRALPSFPKALAGGPANTHVYLGIKNGKPGYAGITTNIGRRSTQHGSRFDQLQQLTTTPLTRGEARAVEEALILRNADTFSNLRHEISINHSYYGDAVQWGEAWLVRNGF